MDFETFLTESAKGYTPRHDEHNAAVAIVKKHSSGVDHTVDDGKTSLHNDTAVHTKHKEALHKSLTDAGFKHKASTFSHVYHKGNTSIHVDNEPDVGAKISDTKSKDHHQVTVDTSHERAKTRKHYGPKTPKPAMYD